MQGSRPASTRDLSTSERRLVEAMHLLGYGRFESLRIERGELILDPWPTVVQHIKLGASETKGWQRAQKQFELRKQVADLFEYVRGVNSGKILTLAVQNGLPFSVEIEHWTEPKREVVDE